MTRMALTWINIGFQNYIRDIILKFQKDKTVTRFFFTGCPHTMMGCNLRRRIYNIHQDETDFVLKTFLLFAMFTRQYVTL